MAQPPVVSLRGPYCCTQVLILTVEPGFGGQKCQTAVLDKVRQLRGQYPTLQITVDGGMSPDTVGQAPHSPSSQPCIIAWKTSTMTAIDLLL